MGDDGIFRFEDFELDLAAAELRRAGAAIAMEPQVFDLIAFLVANHDRVVTKDEIIAEIWNGRIVSDSALSSRINAARRALGDDGSAQRLIRTVHGRGFRFGAVPDSGGDTPTAQGDAKPSIAVLPFIAMSEDRELAFFADGVAEDIIDGLSRFHELSVIARNSSFAFRDTPVSAREIAERLGVTYVLEGSVRAMGQRIRVAVKLIHARDDTTLWSDRYDGDLTDIFSVQDEITEKAVAAVAPQAHYAEMARASRNEATSLSAWGRVMRARWHMDKYLRDDTDAALAILADVVTDAEAPALAHSTEAICRVHRMLNAWAPDPLDEIEAAARAAARALSLDTYDAAAIAVMGLAAMFRWQFDECHDRLDEAIRKNPNLAMGYGFRAVVFGCQGDLPRTLEAYEVASRLSPEDTTRTLWMSGKGIALYSNRAYAETLDNAERMLRIHEGYGPALRQRAAALARLGRMDEAEEAMRAVLRHMPTLTATRLAKMVPVMPEDNQTHWLDGMRMAGLPE